MKKLILLILTLGVMVFLYSCTNPQDFLPTVQADRVFCNYSIITSSGAGVGLINEPGGIDIDSSGNIYVVDISLNKVVKYSPNGDYILEFGETGIFAGQLDYPFDVRVGPNGYIWVAEYQNNRIQKFSKTGVPQEYWTANSPVGIAFDKNNNLLISEYNVGRISRYKRNGTFIEAIGS